jgi:hypothetical protein
MSPDPSTFPPLPPWSDFYVILGSSAAALTGLQFVVISLGADTPRLGGPREIAAFATPTIVHFCATLLLSALLAAPWPTPAAPAALLTLLGLAGTLYSLLIYRRARKQTHYHPVLEDWLCHFLLPLASYATLALSAPFLPHHPTPTLFATAATALTLLFTGIHNAWDAVTYLALGRPPKPTPKTDDSP